MWKWFGITDNAASADSPNATKVVEDPSNSEPLVDIGENNDSKGTENSPTDNDQFKETAKQIGSMLYSFASAATKTATKLKETVDDKLDKTIIGDFNRENDKFVQERREQRIGDAVPPWVGYHEEEAMKRQIISLSSDERNFLRNPPSGVDYKFDMEQMMPVAMAVLCEDPELEKMRFNLVPKKVDEVRFWKNYFYRVSLIKQSTQLSTLALADRDVLGSTRLTSSSTESLNKDKSETLLDIEKPDEKDEEPLEPTADDVAGTPTAHEFVSDTFVPSEEGLSEEERLQMGMGNTDDSTTAVASTDAETTEWEQELQDELESFELVNQGSSDSQDVDPDWEKEIEDMLGVDENDS